MLSCSRVALSAIVLALASPAQCTVSWLPGSAVPGTNAAVLTSLMWDRDGAGPLPPLLVLGGQFSAAGDVAASRIATFDPATGAYGALGTGLDGFVRALAVMPNGDLIAGGEFTTAGGAPANRIARWNGTSWSPLGAGFNAPVLALQVLPSGGLVAGGEFGLSGLSPTPFCAEWNGVAWLAKPGLSFAVQSLATLANGALVAGGGAVLRWTGSGWVPLGAGLSGGVSVMQLQPNGDLFVGGAFSVQATPTNVARWDGLAWTALPAPGGLPVHVLGRLPNGNVAAASRQGLAVGIGDLTVFDGTGWTTVPDPNAWIVTMTTLPGGDLFVGGAFSWVPGVAVGNAALWDGTTWRAPSPGTNARVRAIASAQNGDVLVAGDFSTLTGVAAAGVARRTPTGWVPLGQLGGRVRAVIEMDNGDVVVGGTFWQPPSPAAAHIARWNGSAWTAMGGGLDAEVRALLRLSNGDLVAGGVFGTAGGLPMPGVARWDGLAWQPIGNPAAYLPGPVSAMAQLPSGDLVVGRLWGGHPLVWDGTTWSDFASQTWSFTTIYSTEALLVLRDGRLLAGGQPWFSPTSFCHLGVWDGSTWSSVGQLQGSVSSLLELPDGDVLVGGDFASIGSVPIPCLARWNGTTFQQFAGGASGGVLAMAMAGDGALWIGGDFQHVGTTSSAFMATATTSCPAAAVAFGAGCTGSGGANVLTATALPWLGSRYRSRATGMPGTGFVLRLLSLAPNTALPLPLGGPGCLQIVAGDVLELQLPVAGACSFGLPLPDAAALVGIVFREQVVPFEFSAAGALLGLTSSNALTVTVGNF